MSFFITLVELSDASRRSLEEIPKMHTMIHEGLPLPEYQAFLHDLYHIVWHFCPIMAAAASRCADEFVDVRYHLYHNIDEEKGHEKMLLEDLKVFGVDAETVKCTPPTFPVQAWIAYNYYACERI